MAPLLFRGLRGVNISCASPSSTSIYSNKDNGGGRSSPTQILKDINKGRPVVTTPFFSFKSKSLQRNRNRRKSSASKNERPPSIFQSPTSSSRFLLGDHDDNYASSFEFFPDFEQDPVPDLIKIDPSRFHFGEGDGSLDLRSSASFCRPEKLVAENYLRSNSSISKTLSNDSWEYLDDSGHDHQGSETINLGRNQKQIGFRASTSSWSPEKDDIKNSQVVLKKSVGCGVQEEQIDLRVLKSSSSRCRPVRRDDETPVLNSSFSSRTRDKVVVLKVSLHCKGCEGKVRKHLSRMQGVTSFSIDFPTKKVTVVGDVTPLTVLSSVSKVKNAQLWSSPPAPPQPPSSTSRSR